jgi:hypothetical protein
MEKIHGKEICDLRFNIAVETVLRPAGLKTADFGA